MTSLPVSVFEKRLREKQAEPQEERGFISPEEIFTGKFKEEPKINVFEQRLQQKQVDGEIPLEESFISPEEIFAVNPSQSKVISSKPQDVVTSQDRQANVFEQRLQKAVDPGFWESFLEGIGDDSSSAILLGGGQSVEERRQRATRDLSWTSKFGKYFGDMLGSLPVFTAGGIGGGAAGGAAGAQVGPVGAGVGAAIGSGAGAFALDSLIKSGYDEYLNLIEERPEFQEASFIDVIANMDKSPVLIETAKSGALGSLVALNPMMGALKKIPGVEKLLSATPGKFITPATEIATLTAGSAGLEGRLPTVDDLIMNTALITGLKMSGKAAKGIIDGARRSNDFGIMRNIDKFVFEDLNKLDKAKDLKEVDAILKEVGIRIAKEKVPLSQKEARNVELLESLPKDLQISVVDPKRMKMLVEKQRVEPKELAFDQALNLVDSRIKRGEKEGFFQRLGKSVQRHFDKDKLQTQFLDELYPLKRFVADAIGVTPSQVEVLYTPLNVYRSARLSKGSTGKAAAFLDYETFDFRDTKKVTGKGLTKILEPLRNEAKVVLLENYLASKRAIELNRRGIEPGIDVNAAKTVVKYLAKEYEPYAKEIRQYQDNLLNYYKDSGILSKDQVALMKSVNKDYVPFYRVFENQELTGSRSGKSLQASNLIKRIKGSERDIVSPLESIIKNTFLFMEMAERNKIGQEFVKFSRLTEYGRENVKQVPGRAKITKADPKEIVYQLKRSAKNKDISLDQRLIEQIEAISPETFDIFRRDVFTPGKNQLRVFFDGKPKLFEVPSDIYQTFKSGLGAPDFGLLTKIFSLPASTLRAGAILDVRFIAKNAIRDYFGGQLFKRKEGEFLDPLLSPFRGLNTSVRKDQIFVDWLKSGGGMSTMQSLDAPSVRAKLQETKYNAKKFGPIKLLRQAAEFSEEANRLAEYMRGIKAEGNTKLGREIAAFASRDLSIDFAKAGSIGKYLNQAIPFWNATVQGLEKPIRELYRNPQSRNKTAYRLMTRLGLPSLVIGLMNRGDPEIEELQEQEKDFNWIVRNPISNRIEKIPVPFEPGLVMNGLTRRYINFVLNNDPKAFDGFMNNVIETAVPGLFPQLARAPMEVYFNRNFFTDRPIVPQTRKSLITPLQYSRYTSETARKIGRAFLYMPQYWDSDIASPAVIDHYISSFTGGLGRTAVSIMDEVLRQTGQDSKTVKPSQGILEKFGMDPFKVRYPSANTKSITQFYDNYFESTRIERSLKSMQKEGEEEIFNIIKNKSFYIKMNKAKQAMDKHQEFINKIWLDDTMDPEEKKEMLDANYRNMIDFARRFNEEFDKEKKRQGK